MPRVSELMALLEVVGEVVTRSELVLAIDPGKSLRSFALQFLTSAHLSAHLSLHPLPMVPNVSAMLHQFEFQNNNIFYTLLNFQMLAPALICLVMYSPSRPFLMTSFCFVFLV